MDGELGAEHETQRGRTQVGWWRTRRGWVEAVGIVASLALLAYLVVGLVRDPQPGRAGHQRPVVATTSTTLSPEGEVEQAYREFDAMLARLSPAPNPDDPEIVQRTTGEFRDRLRRVLADQRARRLAVELGPEYGPTKVVVTVKGDAATVKACYVDQSAIVNVATGASVNPMRTVRELQTLTFVREGGRWKLHRLVIETKPGTQELVQCDI